MQHSPQTQVQYPVRVRVALHRQHHAIELYPWTWDAARLLVHPLLSVAPQGIFEPRLRHSHPSHRPLTVHQFPLHAITQYHLSHPGVWQFLDVYLPWWFLQSLQDHWHLILQPHLHLLLEPYSQTCTSVGMVHCFWVARRQDQAWEDSISGSDMTLIDRTFTFIWLKVRFDHWCS